MNEVTIDGYGTSAYPWSTLVDYERGDLVLFLFKQIICSLFKNDTLDMISRDEFKCCSGISDASFNSLRLYGHVGHRRKEALLHIMRYTRLRYLSDLNSAVTFGLVVGDDVPSSLLEPLIRCPSTEAYRRWNLCFYAMCCGLLHKIREQREMTKERLDTILKESSELAGNSNIVYANKKEDVLSGQTYRDFFSQLQSDEYVEVEGRRYPPLSLYYTAVAEQRVDMKRIASTVPTVFVAWSYRYPECLEWMQRTVFRSSLVSELKQSSTDNLLDADPWISFVAHYLNIPPRRKNEDRKAYMSTVPPYYKRAQIVFVNVDPDRRTAEEVYEKLLERCGGWRSFQVPLMSLWAGKRGLQSEYAITAGIRTLPHVIGTEPTRRNYTTFHLEVPQVAYLTPYTVTKEVSEVSTGNESDQWYTVEVEERKNILRELSEFTATSSASISFSAQIDSAYSVHNPYTDISTKALKIKYTSRVFLRGTLFYEDVLRLQRPLTILSQLRDFFFQGQVVEKSVPLQISLKTKTPRGRVRGDQLLVVCASCHRDVLIEREPHFHCLHCSYYEGTLCENCFEGGRHPGHHLVLRVPPGTTDLTLPLLWGPSNVAPLHLFNQRPVFNPTQTHVGIICDRCFKPIGGRRWKCSMCHQYDLCSTCFSKRVKKEGSGAEVEIKRGHSITHPFICIPGARHTTFEELLRPKSICLNIKDALTQAASIN